VKRSKHKLGWMQFEDERQEVSNFVFDRATGESPSAHSKRGEPRLQSCAEKAFKPARSKSDVLVALQANFQHFSGSSILRHKHRYLQNIDMNQQPVKINQQPVNWCIEAH
jgi:hypothetical protein